MSYVFKLYVEDYISNKCGDYCYIFFTEIRSCCKTIGFFYHVSLPLNNADNIDVISFAINNLSLKYISESLGTFRSEDEDEYQHEFSVLRMCIRFEDRHFSKCACSEQKTRTRSRPRLPSLLLGTFRLDYEYEIEYEYDFRISNR